MIISTLVALLTSLVMAQAPSATPAATPAAAPAVSVELPKNSVPPLPPGAPVELLWPKGAPGAHGRGNEDADQPAMSLHLPPKDRATGGAVVVYPGGGYATQAMGHEGADIAAWLNERGVAAFVVRYRLGHRYRHPAPLDDGKRAVRILRSRAKAYGLDPSRIGVWGFSAGGHLAASVSTLFDDGDPRAKDPIERASSRPDFAILCYPVIHMDEPFVHKGSRQRLLGDAPAADLVWRLSLEKQVSPHTPPTFLFHTTADTAVPPENSVDYYLALRRAGVSAELHIYEHGKHGVGLAPADPVLASWGARLEDWLRGRALPARPIR
jgi:acetyl esterase/lipase